MIPLTGGGIGLATLRVLIAVGVAVWIAAGWAGVDDTEAAVVAAAVAIATACVYLLQRRRAARG